MYVAPTFAACPYLRLHIWIPVTTFAIYTKMGFIINMTGPICVRKWLNPWLFHINFTDGEADGETLLGMSDKIPQYLTTLKIGQLKSLNL